jgi:hypothetical protein
MRAHDEVELLLRADGGLVVRRDHPHLIGSFDWLIHQGKLATVLPGIYADPEIARTWQARARAVALRHPDAVLLGAAAARISFWPAAPLATSACSDAIDIALRGRAVTLAAMYEALRMTPHRTGNLERLRLLIDSRNEPWPAAERLSHRLLRAAGITGWQTNLPVEIDSELFYLDIAFTKQKLAIEIDGRLHETDEELFESDRWRQMRSWPRGGESFVSPGRCCKTVRTCS